MFGKSKDLRAIEARLTELDTSIRQLSETVMAVAAKPRGGELLKYLGVLPDRFLKSYFENSPGEHYYAALHGGLESLRGGPAMLGLKSGICRQLHFSTDEFRYWVQAMGHTPSMHRKLWEFFYIAQVLFEQGMLVPGKKGLAFAVGREALPALFATYGCEILATDLDEEAARTEGWVHTGQHSNQVEHLFYESVCPREKFFASVRYQNLNMNQIPEDLAGKFDDPARLVSFGCSDQEQPSPSDTRLLQDARRRCIAVDRKHATGPQILDPTPILVDHDDRQAFRLQARSDDTADPAVSDDDSVIRQAALIDVGEG